MLHSVRVLNWTMLIDEQKITICDLTGLTKSAEIILQTLSTSPLKACLYRYRALFHQRENNDILQYS